MAQVNWNPAEVRKTIQGLDNSIMQMNSESEKINANLPELRKNWVTSKGTDTIRKLDTFLNEDLTNFIGAVSNLKMKVSESEVYLNKMDVA